MDKIQCVDESRWLTDGRHQFNGTMNTTKFHGNNSKFETSNLTMATFSNRRCDAMGACNSYKHSSHSIDCRPSPVSRRSASIPESENRKRERLADRSIDRSINRPWHLIGLGFQSTQLPFRGILSLLLVARPPGSPSHPTSPLWLIKPRSSVSVRCPRTAIRNQIDHRPLDLG